MGLTSTHARLQARDHYSDALRSSLMLCSFVTYLQDGFTSTHACSPRNPRIPIYRFCLQTAFRARMRIFKSGISGSARMREHYSDALISRCNASYFVTYLQDGSYKKHTHWAHYSDALISWCNALFFCNIFARWVLPQHTHERWQRCVRVWCFVLL
jgi:hypothetical protein